MPSHIFGFVVTATLSLLLTSDARGQLLTPADFPNDMIVGVDVDLSPTVQATVSQASFLQPGTAPLNFGGSVRSTLLGPTLINSKRFGVGLDLYSAPDFEKGLLIHGEDVAMKIGGYVKADFIYDFDPIDSTDSFVTTDIPVGAPPRTNSRFHSRETRLSFDTRLLFEERPIRFFVEGDFFGEGDSLRLRHAYGEFDSLLVGQSWTTFTYISAAPATLDFEGSVSSVNRRQAQARWTQPLLGDDLTLALAIEDTQFNIETPVGVTGDPRSPSPDFVGHVRLDRESVKFQAAGLYRVVGFQPTGAEVVTRNAWGFNFAGSILLTNRTKLYSQVLFGEGIGSYRSLPDAAPTFGDRGALLPLFGWMIGGTIDWTDKLSSNFTYAENSLDNTPLQQPDDVKGTSYLSANLIWSPRQHVKVGIEYLYGTRENVDGQSGHANRIQTSLIFNLP